MARAAGHAPEKLKIGIHAIGFVGDTDEAAKEAFYPGWSRAMTEIGRERGWSAATRGQFEALVSPRGAGLIGSPETVVRKLADAHQVLDGVSRFTFQMSSASLNASAMQRSIELLGHEVAPRFKELLHRKTLLLHPKPPPSQG